jgi:uncharacterized protein
MKKLLSAVLTLLLTLSLASIVWAAPNVVQPTEDFYVLDRADVLSDQTERYIIENNKVLFDGCGGELVFVTLDFTGAASIADYAYELFNQWGIGSAENNNGVLVLMSIGAEDYYVLPGEGLDGRLDDPTATYLEPDFAKGDYDAGAQKLFTALYGQVAALYGMDSTPTIPYGSAQSAAVEPDYGYSQGSWAGEAPVQQTPSAKNQSNDEGDSILPSVFFVLALLALLALAAPMTRSIRSRRRSGGDFGAGMFWGSMLGRASRPHAPRPPRYGPVVPPPPPGGFGGFSQNHSSNSSSSGGFSRNSSSSSSSSGSFSRGGSSRGGGFSRGGFTSSSSSSRSSSGFSRGSSSSSRSSSGFSRGSSSSSRSSGGFSRGGSSRGGGFSRRK